MQLSLSQLASYLPTEITLGSMVKFIGAFAAGTLIIGLLGRMIFGKRSGLNHAVSSAMGILLIYAVTIVIYTFNPSGLARYLSPLPFVDFVEDYLYVFPISNADFAPVCSQVLSTVILAFLVNLLDSFIPKGRSIAGWFVLRFLTVVLAMVLHYLVDWASRTFLPGVLVTYAPIILLAVLVIMLLLGALNLLLGLVLATVNPIIGAIYTFFFSNFIGKQLSKAMLTTALLCGVVSLLDHFGYIMICISAAALVAYIPLIIALLVLWYLIGHLL